jgi:hypothetical protein
VATNVTKNRLDQFMAGLKRLGGASGNVGNVSLRQHLDWDEDFYWKVQGTLIEAGSIVPGKGKGGSVRLTEAEGAVSPPVEVLGLKENALYAPLKAAIESKWIKRFGFDEVWVAETHSLGKKDTGGTFTRPDMTAAGVKRYVYLAKRLEIVTFEVKRAEAITITAVLEAIAHREAAHRSYVVYATSRSKFEGAAEADRIMELGQKYGIGIVLAEKPDEVESWEVLLDALRHEPDPTRLDRFLGDLPNEAMKKQLSKWKE